MTDVRTAENIVQKCPHCHMMMDRFVFNGWPCDPEYRCQNRFCPGRPVSEWAQAMTDFARDLQTASQLYPKHEATFLEAAAELLSAASEIEAVQAFAAMVEEPEG